MANAYVQALINGVEKTLPSGLTVFLRPLDATILLRRELPKPIMQVVLKMIGADVPQTPEEDRAETRTIIQQNGTMQTLIDLRIYGELIATECFVSPKIVTELTGNDNEILATWLPTDDCMALTRIVGLPLQRLIDFQFGQDAAVEPVRAVQSDNTDAESSSGDEPDAQEHAGTGLETSPLVDQLPV